MPTKIKIPVRLETPTSQEDLMTTAARLSEVLGNLPPLSRISSGYSTPGGTSPPAAQPARYPDASWSLGKNTASRAPIPELHTTIDCSMEEKVEVRKRSLSRRRSVLEGRYNSADATAEASYEERLPVLKRRRIPARSRSTRAASAVPTGR